MFDSNSAIAASSLLSILGLWILLFWLFRDYWVDRFRQELFSIRDQLFDSAGKGLLAFDHQAYRLLRTTLNGFIQYAHRISWTQGILFYLFVNRDDFSEVGSPFRDRWRDACHDLPSLAREELDCLRGRMHYAVLKHLVLSSPFLILTVIVPVISWAIAQICLAKALSILRGPLDELDRAAMAFGKERASWSPS